MPGQQNLTIGIGGASRSGKTTLAQSIARYFTAHYSVAIFHQDDFIVPEAEIPRIRTEVDWEHPASIDFDRLIAAVSESNHQCDLTIVEGFLLYTDARLYSLFDLHFFLGIDEEEFFQRRRQDRRYGTDAEWYIRHTWDAFMKYGTVPPEIKDEVTFLAQDYDLATLLTLIDRKLTTM